MLIETNVPIAIKVIQNPAPRKINFACIARKIVTLSVNVIN
jgi:hypothetical protein